MGRLPRVADRWMRSNREGRRQSRSAGESSDEASMRAFERQVLKPLLALKVQPLQRSKSAIGGDCAR